jgi:hypothetical protein
VKTVGGDSIQTETFTNITDKEVQKEKEKATARETREAGRESGALKKSKEAVQNTFFENRGSTHPFIGGDKDRNVFKLGYYLDNTPSKPGREKLKQPQFAPQEAFEKFTSSVLTPRPQKKK